MISIDSYHVYHARDEIGRKCNDECLQRNQRLETKIGKTIQQKCLTLDTTAIRPRIAIILNQTPMSLTRVGTGRR